MDLKKAFEKYISPVMWLPVVAWILLGLTVVALLAGIVLPSLDSTANARQFYPNSSRRGTEAYIDVIALSDWLYNINNGEQVYYIVEDVDNYLYVVQLSRDQVAAMSAQSNYWEDEEGSAPAPYRLYGLVQKPSDEVVKAIARTTMMSTDDYYLYFGNTYLNATSSSFENTGNIAFVVALFAAIIFLVLFSIIGGPMKTKKSCMTLLAELGELDNAAHEFSDPNNMVVGKDRARLSGRFLFGKGTGAVVRYEDIDWCYKRTVSNNGAVTSSLIVNSKTLKKRTLFAFPGHDNEGLIQYVIETIAERNPAARIGYSAENIQASKNK